MNLYIVNKWSDPNMFMTMTYVVAAENEERAKEICLDKRDNFSSIECFMIGKAIDN